MDETTLPPADLLAAVLAWRQGHPQASFAELEAAVEVELDRVRAQVLAQAAAPPATAGEERPRCPHCGGAVQSRGERERRLIVAGNQPVPLRRSYSWCPACAAGFFPPG
ncbi:MAG TPA: hypothetical protein VK009_10695 [Chloroflexota bacterium]|jgi:hypothetical protein|nr:hypothetical protein [Chloroflexota bacterium]